MPWAIAIRLIARLAASLLFWRISTNRRRAFANGRGAPGPAPKRRQIDAQAAVMAVRDSVLLTWRALVTGTLLAVTAVAALAGVTILILTPRWLGALLVVAAIAAGVATWFEGRVLFIAVKMRSRRRRDERLRKTAASAPPPGA
jgi:hypothetical protein